MSNNTFKKYTRTLAANVEQVIDVSPSTFVLCAAGDDTFTVRPDGQNPVDLELGLGIDYETDFTKIRIKSTTAQTVALYIGKGNIVDNRMVGRVDISGGIRLAANQTAAYGSDTVGTSAAQIRAANTARGTLLIQNLSVNEIFIGTDSSVTTTNGIKVAAGGNIELTVTSAVYGISAVAGNDIRYLEENL